MECSDRSSGNSHSVDFGAVGRIDVLEGPSGRRRWPDAVKGQIVAESYASDTSVSAIARRHGLAPSQLFAWRRDAKAGKLILPGDEASSFASLLLEVDLLPDIRAIVNWNFPPLDYRRRKTHEAYTV